MYKFYLLENFNNYYNRRIIRYETIEDYLTHQSNLENSYATFDANFIPNDGISTEHIVNAQQLSINWNPNYVVLVDANNNIFQRWFVLDSVRTTMGQYRLSMKRDAISDFYTQSLYSTCFVEKATLDDDNPLIYNNENFSVNQIKQSEAFLKDKTATPWIVGYLSNKDLDIGSLDGVVAVPSTGTPEYYEIEIPAGTIPKGEEIESLSATLGVDSLSIGIDGAIPSIPFTTPTWLTNISKDSQFFEFNLEAGSTGANKYSLAYVFDGNGNTSNVLSTEINDMALARDGLINIGALNVDTGVYVITHGKENWQIELPSLWTVEGFVEDVKEVSEKIVKDFPTTSSVDSMKSAWSYIKGSTGDLYKACPSVKNLTDGSLNSHIGKRYYETSTGTSYVVKDLVAVPKLIYTKITNVNAIDYLTNIWTSGTSNLKQYMESPYTPGEDCFYIGAVVPMAYFKVERYSVDTIKYQLPVKIPALADNPFRMFCMPMNKTVFKNETITGTMTNYKTSSEIPFKVAMDISAKLSGAGWLTDLQILPYCPCQYWLDNDGYIQLPSDDMIEHKYFTWIKTKSANVETVRSFILFPTKSSVSFQIDYEIKIKNKKLENQCDFVRLCSPNYASAFEFTPAKNNGVDYFTINMTLKPHTPFIQIYPNFKELYGNNFNDNRGLILGGDFSLPQVNDAWNTYALNNKTYQASFDRQIQNMETMHGFEKTEKNWEILGNLGDVAAAGGGLLPLALSAYGGKMDWNIMQGRYNETLDYTKDQFGFNLENIQALSQGLSKTSALTINHKLFPFIEFYSCTEQEKQAFMNKIKYNGMTVGIISDLGIAPYIREEETYIKAKLIDININDDAHIANDIASELNKGVRIKK